MKKMWVIVQLLGLLLISTPAQAEQYRIPLGKQGEAYTLPVNFNKRVTANLLLDTGASHTVITPELARQLELTENQVVEHLPVVTVNGRSTLPVVILTSLNIGDYEITNVRAVIQDIDTRTTRLGGLLGMSALRDIDQVTLRLRAQELLLQTGKR